MCRGACGDMSKVSVTSTACKQTQALLLKVVGCGYVESHETKVPFTRLPNFAFQTTRNFSRAMAWKCGWSFPLCGNLACVKQTWARIRTGSDWIRTEANFCRIRTGSDCNFFKNWRIRTGSNCENFCCFNVIILKISKI